MQRAGLLHVVVEVLADVGEAPVAPPAADAEDDLFGLVEDGLDLRSAVVSELGNLSARADDVPEDRRIAHDVGVVLDVERRRDGRHEPGKVLGPADLLKRALLCGGDLVRYGNLVDRAVAFVQRKARLVALAVALAVEVGRSEDAGDARDRLAVDQNGADDGLLGANVMGLKTVANHGCLRTVDRQG